MFVLELHLSDKSFFETQKCLVTDLSTINLLQENKKRAEEEKARRQAREQREKEINEKRQAEV